ncbi:MAG TPA: hypothetical protein VK517_01775 [Cyclobacteriaceae bacterium]|nr:hypothetical protein [Cyclobacteriaceae bacterium]
MKTMSTIFLLASLSALSSCRLFHNNDDPQLPPITMTGKNTFGCLVNGKVWLPKGRYNVPPVEADYTSGSSLSFNAVSTYSGFVFFIRNPILIGQNYVLSDTSKVKVWYEVDTNNAVCVYEDYHVTKGILTLTVFDLQKRVLSGVFEFTTYNPACGDTIKITDGRFDIAEITR